MHFCIVCCSATVQFQVIPCFHAFRTVPMLLVVLQSWYAKTPLGKKRAKAAQGDDEDDKGGKGKGGKGKKGKKKK